MDALIKKQAEHEPIPPATINVIEMVPLNESAVSENNQAISQTINPTSATDDHLNQSSKNIQTRNSQKCASKKLSNLARKKSCTSLQVGNNEKKTKIAAKTAATTQDNKTVSSLVEKLEQKILKIRSLKDDKEALTKHLASVITENHKLTRKIEILENVRDEQNCLEYIVTNGVRFYQNYNLNLTELNVTFLENIPCDFKKDSFFVGKLMEMIFSKEELLLSSATGTKSRNRKKKQVAKMTLDEKKKEFLIKMLTIHISKDILNYYTHQKRLRKVTQHINTKIQNMRSSAK